MLRVIILAVALLIDPAITVGAGMSGCSQLSALSAATGVWASVAGRSPVYPATPSHPPLDPPRAPPFGGSHEGQDCTTCMREKKRPGGRQLDG